MQRSGSNANALFALPSLSLAERSSSWGDRKFQSSRTCCSRLAMPLA
jgi:hypothetical protein